MKEYKHNLENQTNKVEEPVAEYKSIIHDSVKEINKKKEKTPYSDLSKAEIIDMLHEAQEDVRLDHVYTTEEARRRLKIWGLYGQIEYCAALKLFETIMSALQEKILQPVFWKIFLMTHNNIYLAIVFDCRQNVDKMRQMLK